MGNITLTNQHSPQDALRRCALITALSAAMIVLSSGAAAQALRGTASSAASPLLVQTRGNIPMAPAVVNSLSQKAGTPLKVTKNIGAGAYLVRTLRPASVQALHSVANRLATHPDVLGAQLYKQEAPVYMLAPAGHKVTLDGARLAGSSVPMASYRWHQITGPKSGVANTAQRTVTFLARQAASPTGTTADPAAVNPGDLTAPPQQLQCAISAASVRYVSVPRLVSKDAFMCNGAGNGSTPGAGATPPGAGAPPPDSGIPAANPGTPPDTGTPSAGLPPTGSSTPPADTGYPAAGTPPDSYAPPSGYGTPGSTPTGGLGLVLCSGECSKATMVPGGNCSGDCSNVKYNGTPSTPGSICSGDCYGASGGGNCSGECSNISGNSVRVSIRKNAINPTNVIGYRLIATDKTGIAHVRNIYVRVQPNAVQTRRPAAASARPMSLAKNPWAAKAAQRNGSHLSNLY